jgi:aryl-alcohol dehydrogenase-like predicted oxidoreductase
LHLQFISSGYADVILPYLDYNALCIKADALLKTARERNVAVMLGSALCMGLLSGKNPAGVRIRHYNIEKDISVEKAIQMYEWCNRNDVNLMALNYKFILGNPAVNTIVIGASSKQEVRESLDAYKEKIDPVILSSFLKQFDLL